MVEKICNKPMWVDLKGEESVPDTVHHCVVRVGGGNKKIEKDEFVITDAVHKQDGKLENSVEEEMSVLDTQSEQLKQLKPKILMEVSERNIYEPQAKLNYKYTTQLVWHLLRSAQCPKRLVICENCGDDSLFADELDDHLSGNLRDQECSMRNIPCKLCDDTVVAKDMKDHVANRCKKRNITCECGTVIVAETQSDHRILECNAVTRYCSLGCGEKMRVMDMPAHQKSACSKRHLINGKLLLCPLGCGAQVSFAEQFIHMTSMCGKRIVECENHCPEVVREEEVSERSILSGGAGTYLAT